LSKILLNTKQVANTIKGEIPWIYRPWFYSPKQGEIASIENIRAQYQSKPQGFLKSTSPATGIGILASIAGGILWKIGSTKFNGIGKWLSLSVAFGGLFFVFLARCTFGVNLKSDAKTNSN